MCIGAGIFHVGVLAASFSTRVGWQLIGFSSISVMIREHASAAVHRALDRLQAVDLALSLAVTPRKFNGVVKEHRCHGVRPRAKRTIGASRWRQRSRRRAYGIRGSERCREIAWQGFASGKIHLIPVSVESPFSPDRLSDLILTSIHCYAGDECLCPQRGVLSGFFPDTGCSGVDRHANEDQRAQSISLLVCSRRSHRYWACSSPSW